MKLWLVERTDGVEWDEHDSFVIRAPTRKQAIAEARAKQSHGKWKTMQVKEEGPLCIIHQSFVAG